MLGRMTRFILITLSSLLGKGAPKINILAAISGVLDPKGPVYWAYGNAITYAPSGSCLGNPFGGGL